MFRNLRNSLIFSHILPILVIIPLLGVAILYILETRVLLPGVYDNLVADARLMAELSRGRQEFWQDAATAQALVNSASPYLNGQVSLLQLDGSVLATGASEDAALRNTRLELPDMSGLRRGEVFERQHGPSAEVYTPVINDSGQILGLVRMTTQVVTVTEEIFQLRYLMGGMLMLGVIAGVVLGSFLAVRINRPIQHVTHSISSLADGNWNDHLPETGFIETRNLVRTVNELVDRLHSLEQARRQLLANLVHELGRPLGAVRSATQALLKGADQDPQLSHELLRGMDGETKRLQLLLDDLAELHDQVLGAMELRLVEIDLPLWLTEILAPWEVTARQKDLCWKVSIPADLPTIRADPDRLAQVVGNLLSNAIKFTPQDGIISTSAGVTSERIWIKVEDNGPGISKEEQEIIFKPFYRGSQGKRIVQGMGLGLSIALDIVHAHGGEIIVESQPGKGSSFIIWLNLRSS